MKYAISKTGPYLYLLTILSIIFVDTKSTHRHFLKKHTNGVNQQIEFKCQKLLPIEPGKFNLSTKEPIEQTYLPLERVAYNSDEGYERWKTKDLNNNNIVDLKIFLKNKGKDVWRYKDKYTSPEKECSQLSYLNQLIKVQKIEGIKFEECLIPDNQGGESEIPYMNLFKKPPGEALSEKCILNDCRESLSKIARFVLRLIQVASTGPNSFFTIGNINADNIYIMEKGPETVLTVRNMKINTNPENDIKNRPWKNDLHDLGFMLAKLMTRNCDFLISEISSPSPIKLFIQIHEMTNYIFEDLDIGVPKDFTFSSSGHMTISQKELLLNSSLYDFITRCLRGDRQFSSPGEAANHAFLQENPKKLLERPSD